MTTKTIQARDCPKCKLKRRIFHGNRCLTCHEEKLTEKRLEDISAHFQPASPYNEYLMELFLSYIRKCKLRSGYAMQAESLKEILESKPIENISSWEDIYRLSATYEVWDTKYRKSGCAFKKIGRMLQALGVIGHSEEEGSNQKHLKNMISKVSSENLVWVNSFLAMLSLKKRSLRTKVVYAQQIRALQAWLEEHHRCSNLSLLTQSKSREYLQYLRNKNRSQNQLYCIFKNLSKFYRWGVQQKNIVANPFNNIIVGKPIPKTRHCSEEDIKKLFNFIRNKKSDPEAALIITLILFFGLTKEDLIHSCISIDPDGGFSILIRQKTRTYRQRNRNREKQLKLPKTPAWLLNLQTRYLETWQKQFSNLKQLYGKKPLLLSHLNHWYTIPINSKIFDNRLKHATQLALDGRSVPFIILKNTCGVIYTIFNDASMLTRLGWSRNHAFVYVYRQREIYLPKN